MSQTFHGFPVNDQLPLKEGDTLESLALEPIFLVRQRIELMEYTRGLIRYIIGANCFGKLNFNHGDNPKYTYIGMHGQIGLSTGSRMCFRHNQTYIILNPGAKELSGCSLVEHIEFGI